MEAVLSLLVLTVVPEEIYSEQVPAAEDLIGKRDPDDVELLALALSLGCPVWSNDNDLKQLQEIKVYTTAEVLQRLGR